MNAVYASRMATTPESRAKLPLATPRIITKTMLTTKTASIDHATQAERFRSMPPRLLRTAAIALRETALAYSATVLGSLRMA
jgi:hypothetical protein